MKKILLPLLLLCTLFMLCGCGRKETVTVLSFSGEGCKVNGPNSRVVVISDKAVTITSEGVYELTGTGKLPLIVNAASGKAVYLTLNGLDLSCDNSAPIWIQKASMVVINLKEGTQNTITDRHLYTEIADSSEGKDALTEIPSAAICSKAPLLLQGNGKLILSAESYNGISTNDTLTIKGGNLTINAKHHGLKGKDYVSISGGNIAIKAQDGDGIKATNTDNQSLGYINITGGNITVNANDEGIFAPSSLSVSGGNLVIKSKKTALQTTGTLTLNGGIIDITTTAVPLNGAQKNLTTGVLITVNGRPYKP